MPASDVLDPTTVAEIRALIPDLSFPDSFALIRSTLTPDGAGGSTPTDTQVATGVCLLQGPFALTRSHLEVISAIERDIIPWLVLLPYGTDVRPQDTLKLNGSRVFRVKTSVQEETWGMLTTAICEEVR